MQDVNIKSMQKYNIIYLILANWLFKIYAILHKKRGFFYRNPLNSLILPAPKKIDIQFLLKNIQATRNLAVSNIF